MTESSAETSTIAFIDSGIGGIPYLLHAVTHIQGISAVYVSDTGYFPYGNKFTEDLKKRLHAIVSALLDRFDLKMIVLACNTASVVALDYLRSTFPVDFVGTVPAVKPAVQVTANRNIGIMATDQTLKDPYLQELISNFASNTSIHKVPAADLIESIEHNFFDIRENSSAALEPSADMIRRAGCDTIVLGCTHFTHLEGQMRKSWGPNVNIVDSRRGISRQIYRLLHGLSSDSSPELSRLENTGHSNGQFFVTDLSRQEYYKRVADFYTLNYNGVLHVS